MQKRAICGAGPSRAAVPCIVTVLIVLLSGCAATRPDPQAEAAAAQAVGLDGAIAFHTEGGPLDEAEVGDALTLVDAVRRAVTTDPGLQAALARVRIAMADADQARLLPNPVLNCRAPLGTGQAADRSVARAGPDPGAPDAATGQRGRQPAAAGGRRRGDRGAGRGRARCKSGTRASRHRLRSSLCSRSGLPLLERLAADGQVPPRCRRGHPGGRRDP
jgi:outer membrane protein TolC